MTECIAFKKMSKQDSASKIVLKTRGRKSRKANFASLSASFDTNNGNMVISNIAGRKKEAPVVEKAKPPTFGQVMKKASDKAFRGGIAGFAAGIVQVGSFMWMRTAMNYQYVNGGNFIGSLSALYKEGGIPRFYKGVQFAIMQNPLARFGDTAANAGVIAVIDAYYPHLPVALKTGFSTAGGAAWRIFLTPLDTLKTTLQVKGDTAMKQLTLKIKEGGIGVLYAGMFANFAGNWVGQYPWFATYNYLQEKVPAKTGKMKYVRNAGIGVVAAAASDIVSNSLRVIKTVKQTTPDANLSYAGAVKMIIEKDGVQGLFLRGLSTRLLTNMLQSMVFSVIWKAAEEELSKPKVEKVVATKKK